MSSQKYAIRFGRFSGMRYVVGALVCGVGCSISAQTAPKGEVQQEPAKKVVFVPVLKVGEATKKLLDMQARGTMASDKQYPMPVAVAEKVYQRYVDSFSHPIPEKSGSALEKLK